MKNQKSSKKFQNGYKNTQNEASQFYLCFQNITFRTTNLWAYNWVGLQPGWLIIGIIRYFVNSHTQSILTAQT